MNNTFVPSNFSILMVDDNPKNLQLLGTTLRNEGYNLEFATSGKMALNWVSKKIFDLILLDIMMPEMSGFEVCEKIRNIPEYNDVPIVFLTAKTEKESIVQGFKLGAQDYITKPFDTSELLARVRTHLELRYSREQLKSINKNLEELVKERTRELEILNAQLQAANQELINLDKAKAEFLHIIAHEIRTPLNGIKGSIDIIKELNMGNSLGSLFSILEESVTRLERFALLALKITQLRTGKYELDLQPITCAQLFDSVIKKNELNINRKSLQIIKHIDPELKIMVDWELLTQCIHSIIDNAIKFSPQAGKIIIEADESENHIILKVKDEGPGFSQKALDHLFKLFSPGEKHINENEGIDLAMAKMIMDVHRGEIMVNNYEKGALVTLLFPKVTTELVIR